MLNMTASIEVVARRRLGGGGDNRSCEGDSAPDEAQVALSGIRPRVGQVAPEVGCLAHATHLPPVLLQARLQHSPITWPSALSTTAISGSSGRIASAITPVFT